MTKFILKRGPKFLSALCCSLLLLSACTSTMKSGDNIEERAMGRWDALLSEDVEAAYEYLSPGYRSSVSSTQYQRAVLLQRVRWTNAEYRSSQCDETVCNVNVLVGFTIYGALPGVKSFSNASNVSESWVLADGQWYFVPDD